MHDIIYDADTPEGKLFDIVLLFLIIASIVLVMLESVAELDAKYHDFFNISEFHFFSIFPKSEIKTLFTTKLKI